MSQPVSGLKIEEFERLPFTIQAVELTSDNMEAVAQWCGGQVRTSGKKGKANPQKYIKVDVKRALNDRQTMAYVGDWVLRAGSGFKVYTPKAFSESFRKKVEHMVTVVGNMATREKVEEKNELDQIDSTTPDSLPTGGENSSFISAH